MKTLNLLMFCFFSNNISISHRKFYFPSIFPRHVILKNTNSVYPKRRQVLANTKRSLLPEIFGSVRPEIFDGKSWINFFDTSNFQKHRKDGLTKFLETKSFPHRFVIHPSDSTKFLHPTSGQHKKLGNTRDF